LSGASPDQRKRCAWAHASPLDIVYHDEEWGVPSRDDQHLFEMLILEGAQAGLSWTTILNKREGYRKAYAEFEPRKVARFDAARRRRMLENPAIVRNRLKVESSVDNAAAFLAVVKEHGSFAEYVWAFVDGQRRVNRWKSMSRVPAMTVESKAMSRELKRRGFRFVGPTICYAFMQAVGMVNDHLVDCFRHDEV
jgi:DNA-3-methyladenine glycosylase I